MINKVTLLGRLGRDPVLKTFPDGGALANLRLITSRRWKAPSGDYVEKIQGHNVVLKSATVAKRLADTLHKGQLVYVEGTLETRQWTNGDGKQQYITEVVVRPYEGVLRKLAMPSGTVAPSETSTTPATQANTATTPAVADAVQAQEQEEDIDFFASLQEDDFPEF